MRDTTKKTGHTPQRGDYADRRPPQLTASERFEAFHNPVLWAKLTETQRKVAALMEEIDPLTGKPLTVVEVARRLDVSRKNVYKVLAQIGRKALKLAS